MNIVIGLKQKMFATLIIIALQLQGMFALLIILDAFAKNSFMPLRHGLDFSSEIGMSPA